MHTQLRYICWAWRRRLRLGPEDVFLQKIPISFDPSVQVRLNMPRQCSSVHR